MDEVPTNTPEQKNKFNPLLLVGVIVVVAFVGWIIWSSSMNKTANQSSSMKQQVSQSQPTKPQSTQKPTPSESQTEKNISVEGGSFYFKPNEIHVKKGDKVKITFTNAGGVHDFVIDELNVRTNRIQSGETTTVEFTPDKTGTFEYYCSVGNHQAMGMKGNLIVD